MPASSIVVGGRRTRRPGPYSEVDASSLSRKGPGIRSLVLIGEAVGGTPGSVKTRGKPTFLSAATPDRVRRYFRSGPLRNAGLFGFKASDDDRIPNGPARVLFYKLNPATQATATLTNPSGAALDLTSRDYGAFASQIGVQILPGSARGYAVIATLEDLVESGDNIGGLPAFQARYDADGELDTVRVVVDATGSRVTFSESLAAEVAVATHNAGDAAVVLSANAYDTVQKATVYGTNAANAPISETLALNGVTPVTGALAFETITGVRLDGATRGIITVRDEQVAPNTSFTVAATLTANHDSGQEVEILSSDADDVGQVAVIYGFSATGVALQEAITLNGTTVVAGLKQFGKITAAQLSGVCEGTITFRSKTGESIAFTITTGNLSAGVNIAKGIYVPNKAALNGALTVRLNVAPGAGTFFVVVRGRSTAGVVSAERLVITEVAAATTTLFSELTHVEIGRGEAANPVVISGTAIDCPRTTHSTVQKVVDAINGKRGFHAVAVCG